MPGLSKVRQFKDDNVRRWSSVTLASGEPCWISVARSSVIVKQSRFGLFGPRLYRETDVYKSAAAAAALAYFYPGNLLPRGFSNPVLSALTNASCAE